jgi:hypothetical protein
MDWGHLGFFLFGGFVGMFVGFIGLGLCVAARRGDEHLIRLQSKAQRRAAVVRLRDYRMPTAAGGSRDDVA